MKLVKSLLLGSAAGLAAVAGAQAADLPFRKAAPVDYVRVCDWVSGGGYFYIPGTDTCLKVGGEVRFEYAWHENKSAFVTTPSYGAFAQPLLNGTVLPGRNKNDSGFLARGKIEVDVRTQTAYGQLRANVRVESDRYNGNENSAYGTGGSSPTTLDRGYITFAGITAGRVQSFFDFFADNYNYDGIATSDESTSVLAYTATFGGGFSATVSVEDPNEGRRNGIGNLGNVNVAGLGPVGATYAGTRYPDVVGQLRYDQAWGAIQLSGAFHDVNTIAGSSLGGFTHSDEAGFAVQAGIDVKLPMIAAGDELWLEGAYQEGAYLYQDSGTNLNSGFTANYIGGFIHPDVDAVAIPNGVGGYTLALGKGFSVLGAFHHYFTPQFHDVLYGSYEEISYGSTVKNADWRFGGIGDGSQYKIGNQFIFTPVHNLDLGVDVMYAKVNQDITAPPGFGKGYFKALGIDPDPDSFEVRLRLNRDF